MDMSGLYLVGEKNPNKTILSEIYQTRTKEHLIPVDLGMSQHED